MANFDTCMMASVSKQKPDSPASAARRRAPVDRYLDIELFKALSDPTRANLLACLMKCRRPCSVSEVAECCDVDFSVVARHLGLLARAGVLDADKKGRTVWYSARCAEVSKQLRELADAIEACCPTDSVDSCGCGTDACKARSNRKTPKRR